MSETPAIEAERLVKRYGPTRALTGLDLAVPAGMIYGLLGPTGRVRPPRCASSPPCCGRTAGGRGCSAATWCSRRLRCGAASGSPASTRRWDESLTGWANLVMIGQLSRLTGKAARWRADQMLARFDLTSVASRAVRTYSGGMRRRLDLAASLIGGPRSCSSMSRPPAWTPAPER